MKRLQVIPEVEPRTATLASPYPYWITICLGAFLLFSLQLVTGKYFLPWFGGTPAMWTTCMFFFQTLLVGGYLYSHALSDGVALRKQGRVHSIVLTGAVLFCAVLAFTWHSPLLPNANWKPVGAENPVAR